MKENIALLGLTIIFLLISFIFHFFLLRAGKIRFVVLSLLYFAAIYYMFDRAVYLHQLLRDRVFTLNSVTPMNY
ncbi:MAG: hypothetical protein C5B59_10890 [Bacteroidetes bacterium]|nr:MAG: hypothetical protein C5B59_10890 [Bacteroidota bacterium]